MNSAALGRRLVVMGVLAGLSACDCSGRLGGVETGFRVDSGTLSFGRALEGTQVARVVTLHSTGRVDLSVEAQLTGPFRASSSILVPGGGEVDLTVVFTAGHEVAKGQLRLTANKKTVVVELDGEGVRPLNCLPSAQCRLSRFELDTNSCVETEAPEGSSCVPQGECLENGVCRAGACVGSPRTCDDRDKCTSDACAATLGCVHTPVSCPAPAHPCKVAMCDPEQGCGEAPALDGTPCGAIDCVTANLCIAGECRAVPTPDGFICSPRTPCQGEGRCRSQACERPDAGEMVPSFFVPLPPGTVPMTAGDEPSLLAYAGNLYWGACAQDAGCQLWSLTGGGFQRFVRPFGDEAPRRVRAVTSTGVWVSTPTGVELYSTSGGSPAGRIDLSLAPPHPALPPGYAPYLLPQGFGVGAGGEVVLALGWTPGPDAGGDGGALDAGAEDGGALDGGAEDGGSDDGGTDGGLDGGLDGGQDGGLDGGQDGGADGGPGAATWLWPGARTVWVVGRDAGTWSVALSDAGRLDHLALTAADALGLWDSTRSTLVGVDATGVTYQVGGTGPGEPSLIAEEGFLGGAATFVAPDAGVVAQLSWDGGTQMLQPLAGQVLMSGGFAYVFFRGCVAPWGPPCAEDEKATFVRVFRAADGAPLWDAKVLPEGAPGVLHGSAAVTSGVGAVASFTSAFLDGAWRSHAQLFAQGRRLFVCPLPPDGRIGSSLFDRGTLFVLVERGGLWRLEAYDLQAMPVATSGWPVPGGVGGARRSRP